MTACLLLAVILSAAGMCVTGQLLYTETTLRHGRVVSCYMSSWSYWRKDEGKFQIENIDPNLCTHVIYSFAGLDPDTNSIKSLDGYLDLSNGLRNYDKIVSLRDRYRHLKVLIAIGGWNEGSGRYSKMAASDTSRQAFVKSVVAFLRKHGFDGLDLDWEYPANREGGRTEDKGNFVKLVKELRAAFASDGFLLTAAIGANKDVIDTGYDVPTLSRYLNYFHVMCYDYHGDWEHVTGHNTPLYARPSEEGTPQGNLNVNFTINYLKSLGAPASKLVLGTAFYGRTFILKDRNNTEIGAPTVGKGFQGRYSKQTGFVGYNEVCDLQKNSSNPWMVRWDDHYRAPYMYRGQQWVGFEDEQSIADKGEYAMSEGLAGVMVWTIDTDDFRGVCKRRRRYPLLVSLNRAMALSELRRSSGARSAILSVTSLSLCALLLHWL